LLDGTPVLDIKPYVPYADAFVAARAGWLDALGQPMDAPDRFEPVSGSVESELDGSDSEI
jgi:tRNA (Thr-GGU) A37 N-methylase